MVFSMTASFQRTYNAAMSGIFGINSGAGNNRNALAKSFHAVAKIRPGAPEEATADAVLHENLVKMYNDECRLLSAPLVETMIDVVRDAQSDVVRHVGVDLLCSSPLSIGQVSAPVLAKRWPEMDKMLMARDRTDAKDRIKLLDMAGSLAVSRRCPVQGVLPIVKSLVAVLNGDGKDIKPDPDIGVQRAAIAAQTHILSIETYGIAGKEIFQTLAFQGGGQANQENRVGALKRWEMLAPRESQRFLALNKPLREVQKHGPEFCVYAAKIMGDLKNFSAPARDTLRVTLQAAEEHWPRLNNVADSIRHILNSMPPEKTRSEAPKTLSAPQLKAAG